MTAMIADERLEARLIAERQALGHDRYDEVWEGVYFMSPLANNEHQQFASRLAMVLQEALGFDSDANVYAGVNVSDRSEDWTRNYRVPDVAVVLPGGRAEDCGEFLLGGPDFVAEIVSPGDQTLEKIPFYAQAGVRELLVVHRQPWSLELYALANQELTLAARGDVGDGEFRKSSTLPLSFRLVSRPGNSRPRLEVALANGTKRWLV
jgi:Uma2 family endonuclease